MVVVQVVETRSFQAWFGTDRRMRRRIRNALGPIGRGGTVFSNVDGERGRRADRRARMVVTRLRHRRNSFEVEGEGSSLEGGLRGNFG